MGAHGLHGRRMESNQPAFFPRYHATEPTQIGSTNSVSLSRFWPYSCAHACMQAISEAAKQSAQLCSDR